MIMICRIHNRRFDDTMSWYVIFTHEGWDSYSKPELNEDEYIRICFLKRSKDK